MMFAGRRFDHMGFAGRIEDGYGRDGMRVSKFRS